MLARNVCMFIAAFCLAGCDNTLRDIVDPVQEVPVVPRQNEPLGFSKKLSDAALARLKHTVIYNPTYLKIPYPGGDVPAYMGVCSDEVIRSYRALGIDLQKNVHQEMLAHFEAFPSRSRWGLQTTDTNIDHRRVPNLEVLFTRKGVRLKISRNASDYLPGDLVTWSVQGNTVDLSKISPISMIFVS